MRDDIRRAERLDLAQTALHSYWVWPFPEDCRRDTNPGAVSGGVVSPLLAGWTRDPRSLGRLHRRHSGDRCHDHSREPHIVRHQERMAVQHVGRC